VNVGDLQRFAAGNEVNPESLVEVGLVKKRNDGIKLLANGEISHGLTIRVHKASAAAVAKVEAAGGRVELIAAQKGK
jgi:large subunit ribosomal protein L15